MTVRILTGDCIDVMRTLSNESIDAIVTDPPYGLAFMGKEWDNFKPGDSPMRRSGELDAVNAGASRQGGRQRAGADYLKRQCRDMQAFQAQATRWGLEMERVLTPGGHLLAFGGTRTYHRLACGLEDAGFEIRDSIHWCYGSGFPKSLNLDGGLGTALKPAHEPIVLARKRLCGTVAATVAKFGTGALNVDGARVEADGGSPAASRRANAPAPSLRQDEREASGRPLVDRTSPERYAEAREGEAFGRWPPNLLLSHAPECVEGGKCAEDCAVAEMDRQSGMSAAKDEREGLRGGTAWHGRESLGSPDGVGRWPADAGGGASRFFPVFRYEAKPSRAERDGGLEGRAPTRGGSETFDPRTRDGVGADRMPMRRNAHPTVKPIALMAWLVQLVTPKGGTVLDPFLGSGTTAIACQRLGLSCIGIEKEAEYVAIAEARIRGDQPLFSNVQK